MSNSLETALADEVLAEVARQRVSAKEMQARTGIKPRTWENYLVNRSSRIPVSAIYAMADALGVAGSELMRRAEERAAGMETHEDRAEAALRRATPAAQRRARKLAREVRSQPEEDASADRTGGPGVSRSASTGR